METNNFPVPAQKRALTFLLGGLVVIIFASVLYRVENPSIVQREERRNMPAGMENMGSMDNITAMMKQLQDHPEDINSMRALGMAFMEMQAWDKALSFWSMILEKEPDNTMALNQKGLCFYEAKQYPEAVEQFERLVALEPTNFHAHFNLGILYKYYLEKLDQAAAHFKIVIDASPEGHGEMVESARRELPQN